MKARSSASGRASGTRAHARRRHAAWRPADRLSSESGAIRKLRDRVRDLEVLRAGFSGLCQQLAVAWRQIVADNERLRLQLLLHGAGLPPHGIALPAPWPQLPEVGGAVTLSTGASPAFRPALTQPASLLAGPPGCAAGPAAKVNNITAQLHL